MRILLSQFGGIAPRYSPEKLPEAAAQVAENTDLHTGSIASFKQTGIATALTTTRPILQTAYLWRVNDIEYWFRFQHEVELARSPIADDENKRIYWTGDNRFVDANGEAYPQMSYTPIAYTGGTDYPQNSYRLGIPQPSLPVSTAADVVGLRGTGLLHSGDLAGDARESPDGSEVVGVFLADASHAVLRKSCSRAWIV